MNLLRNRSIGFQPTLHYIRKKGIEIYLKTVSKVTIQPVKVLDNLCECKVSFLHSAVVSQNQRTNGPVNAHLISGPTVSVSTKTSKLDPGQPRVIVYINLLELESQMLHAKFQDNRTSGSGEEDY